MQLNVNGRIRVVEPPWRDETLLDVLREHLGLCGTKYGCGVGLCGACTVQVDDEAQRACLLRVADLRGRRITTVEGLALGEGLHPLQQAWLDEHVPQCGYCQAGQLVAAAALLARQPRPSNAEIDSALAGHLCRCGTQQRVRIAIQRAALRSDGT